MPSSTDSSKGQAALDPNVECLLLVHELTKEMKKDPKAKDEERISTASLRRLLFLLEQVEPTEHLSGDEELKEDMMRLVHQRLGDEHSFQAWKNKCEPKSTPLQEIEYAKRLYDESMGCTERTSPEELLKALESAPIGSELICPNKGVSVDWILDVFIKSPFLQRLADIDCELWFFRKVCVIEMLRRLDFKSGPFVEHVDTYHKATKSEVFHSPIAQNATLFFSYTGRYSMANFIELLDQLRGEYIWMDVFCVDQFAWTGHSKSDEIQQLRKTLVQDLESQISTIGKVALALEHWNQTMLTLNQIWVLWEVFNAVRAGANFRILMTEAERNKYLECFNESEQYARIQAALGEINCENAKSQDGYARQQILQRIQEAGAYEVSCRVTDAVRGWYLESGGEHVKNLDRTETSSWVFIKNFASLLTDQGKLEQAEPLRRMAYERDAQAMGFDHPHTLISMNNLANLLRSQGKLEEAEPLFREALETCQRVIGNDHPHTLISMNNLATLLHDQGKLEEAEPVYRKALETRQRVLGNDHPDTLSSMNNLASLLYNQGKLEEAEPLYREALEKQQRVLGNDHPDTLFSMNNLANLLSEQGKLDEAEPLYRKALETQQRVLGNDHPHTLDSMSNLAILLGEQGNVMEAERLKRVVLEARQRILGTDHPHTFVAMNNLAATLKKLCKLKEAEELIRTALDGLSRVLGPEHPHTMICKESLSKLMAAKQHGASDVASG